MGAPNKLTGITIVMPTSGLAPTIPQTVHSVIACQKPMSWELIVVQNGDATCAFFALSSGNCRENPLHSVHEPTPGLLGGRHRGLAESSKYNVIVFIDDDIEVSHTWLKSICEAFEDPAVAMVGGPCFPVYESKPPLWINAFWRSHLDRGRSCGFLSLLDYGNAICEIDPDLIWGLNFAIRKSVLQEVGGFHPDGVPWEKRRYRGDGESAVSLAVKGKGYKSIYHPGAAVKHIIPSSRLTLEYFQRRSYLQGISDSYTQLRRKHLHGESSLPSPNLTSRICTIPRRFARGLKRAVGMGQMPLTPEQEVVRQAYREGFQYHQSEFENDEALREWVLRENYWDYTYPVPKLINEPNYEY